MDQYYTRQEIVMASLHSILKAVKRFSGEVSIIDFSAGDGRLGTLLIDNGFPQSQLFEFDIQPKHPRIQSKDWFDVKQIETSHPNCILVFNPPFGKGAHTACRFIEHALQLEQINIVAAFLVLPVYPIAFINTESHDVKLLPPNSFFVTNDEEPYSAPATYHEVITRPGAFLDFRLYTSTPTKPYHYPINELVPYIAQDTRYKKFSEVKHLLPIAMIRKVGHYAGLTAIVVEKKKATLYITNGEELNHETIEFDPNCAPEKRPWVGGKQRWKLTSFMDDIEATGDRTGCAALKILPHSETSLLNGKKLHSDIEGFIRFMMSNKDAIRGGGKGPKSIGIGTFNWIMAFGM
jgi:sRNA-binding regulator protein Hfq